MIHYDKFLLESFSADIMGEQDTWREIPFHCPSWQTARTSMQRTHESFLQPPGDTGRTQNQHNHGNDGDALERGAIAEIRLANAHRCFCAKHTCRLAAVLVGHVRIRGTPPPYTQFTWNTMERLLGAGIKRKNNKLHIPIRLYSLKNV